MFPTATEDPVLLDAERAAISPALRLSTDRIDEAVYAVLARLATWNGALQITFERRTPSPERRQRSPSATPAATPASSARPTRRG